MACLEIGLRYSAYSCSIAPAVGSLVSGFECDPEATKDRNLTNDDQIHQHDSARRELLAESLLVGLHPVKLDSNDRITIPTSYRTRLCVDQHDIKSVIAVIDRQRSLSLYGTRSWDGAGVTRVLTELGGVGSSDSAFVGAYASRLRVDAQWRVRIPAHIIEVLAVGKDRETREFVLSGALNSIRLWNRSRWEEFLSNAADSFFAEDGNPLDSAHKGPSS